MREGFGESLSGLAEAEVGDDLGDALRGDAECEGDEGGFGESVLVEFADEVVELALAGAALHAAGRDSTRWSAPAASHATSRRARLIVALRAKRYPFHDV